MKEYDLGNIENMDENMINAYLEASTLDTPDLWDKIEPGIDEAFADIKKRNTILRKNRLIKSFGLIAAGIFILIIAAPIFISGRIRSESDASNYFSTSSDVCEESEDVSSWNDGYALDKDYASNDFITEAEGSINDSVEEADGTVIGSVAGESFSNSSDNSIVFDDRMLCIEGEIFVTDDTNTSYTIRVDKILLNEYYEYELKEGDLITISNTETIENVTLPTKCLNIEIHKLQKTDVSKYEGTLISY